MLLDIVMIVVVGLIIGLIARLILPGKQAMGWMATTLLGIGGAFVGGLGGQALGLYEAGAPVGWIGAVVGALVLLFAYQLIRRAAS